MTDTDVQNATQKEVDQKIELATAALDKQYGKGTVMRLDADPQPWPHTSTGALSLDIALGIGGLPKGRIVEIYGPESCLDANTFIQYEVRSPSGERQNHKGGTIERLYHRFHGIPQSGRGYYQRPQTADSVYYAPCMNDEGRIFQNRIVDVVDSGVKKCFCLKTTGGEVIEATEDHKFFVGNGFLPLKDISTGDVVYIHNSTPFKGRSESRVHRKEVLVKHHPYGAEKVIEGKYRYKRMHEYRAVMEAHINELDYDVYIKKLNAGDLEGITFLDPQYHIHHIDEDPTNNDISNLEIVDASEHGRLHASERHNNLRYVAVEDVVESIEPVGERQTYDVKMQDPYNNFVANRFVVHNSGKSTVCLNALANAQKEGGRCLFIDAEHAVDPVYARALGVSLEDMHFAQPKTGEEALEILERMVSTGGIDLAIVDSVAGLVPRAELEGNMGDSHMGVMPRLMSQAMRKLTGLTSDTGTTVVFVNQIREKIGIMFGNPETTPGGRALKFHSSVRIDLRRKDTVKSKDGEVIGAEVEAKIVKNKVAPPYRRARFQIIYGKGIHQMHALLEAAMAFGVIKKKGGGYYEYEGENVARGEEDMIEFLASDLEQTKKIEQETRRHAGLDL